jgi:D-alanine-D-alanine ligase
VIGNGDQAVVLPLSEITYPEHAGPKFLTFDGKWVNDSLDFQVSKAQCPCHVSPRMEGRIKDIALRAYHTMGCQDYARVDFRLQEEFPFVLEVNPNPCINPDDSGFVRSGKTAGYSYADLVLNIVQNSVHCHPHAMQPGYLPVVEYQDPGG